MGKYAKAIFLNPRNASAYEARGLMYRSYKEYKRAINDFTKAIPLDLKTSAGYLNRGVSYLQLKQYQKTYRDFQRLLQLSPNDPQAPQMRSWIEQMKKEGIIK